MTIWKFPLEVTDEQVVRLPTGAQILCVQVQGTTPCLWAKVDPMAAPKEWRVVTRGTGNPAKANDGSYVGTYQMHSGRLIFHVFMMPGA
jgi:uncharacterized protein with FMN-binding domain